MRTFWVIAGVGALFCLPVGAADPVGSPLQAVWKEQHIEFSYLGRTARYSCQGLRDKMTALLLDLGARRYLGPRLSLVFSSPALPDPSAKPLHAGDLLAVDARFEPFTLTSDAFRNYGVGDCELVQEFTREILPHFSARDVKQDITCVPYQASGSRFLVRGEVLRAAKIPAVR
jgi:hypothetical protein